MVRVNLRSGKCWLVASRAFGCTDLRQPEIENLGVPALGDEDVGGLDVAVDDAFGVGGVERVGDLDAERSEPSSISSGLPAIRCFSVCPSRNFHGDEGSPIVLVNLVDRADVRMVQSGRSLGFPLETAESLRVVGEFVGQELQGDVATELEVLRLVDHTHAPAADPLEDAVVGDRLPHGLGGRGHWLEC